MFFCRKHVIILLILLLVAILSSLLFPSNLMEGIDGNAELDLIKHVEKTGIELKKNEVKHHDKINNLNNSIMSFNETNNNKSKPVHSIQSNLFMNEVEDEDDLYILKSKIIPPVCPICPTGLPCKNKIKKKCQPCPPCAKCPEPSFDCKKVPNYSSTRNKYLPRAILTDFTQYGM